MVFSSQIFDNALIAAGLLEDPRAGQLRGIMLDYLKMVSAIVYSFGRMKVLPKFGFIWGGFVAGENQRGGEQRGGEAFWDLMYKIQPAIGPIGPGLKHICSILFALVIPRKFQLLVICLIITPFARFSILLEIFVWILIIFQHFHWLDCFFFNYYYRGTENKGVRWLCEGHWNLWADSIVYYRLKPSQKRCVDIQHLDHQLWADKVFRGGQLWDALRPPHAGPPEPAAGWRPERRGGGHRNGGTRPGIGEGKLEPSDRATI